MPITEREAKERLREMAPDPELVTFYEAQVAVWMIDDPRYFWTKPWKWAKEYAAWDRYGKPTDPDDKGWDEFCEAVG